MPKPLLASCRTSFDSRKEGELAPMLESETHWEAEMENRHALERIGDGYWLAPRIFRKCVSACDFTK